MIFLSTPSARRATKIDKAKEDLQKISIHALSEEGDKRAFADALATAKFLSTPSARRATFLCRCR